MKIHSEFLNYGLVVVITLTVALILIRILRFFLKRAIDKSSESLRVDPTNYQFLSNAIPLIILPFAVIVIFYAIPALRTLGLTLFAGAGIFAAIAGFASQQAFSNIIGGIFIVIFKPFRVGDIIRVGTDYHGMVEDITLRHSVIRNFENRRIVIPNSVISDETILNSTITDEKVCMFIEIGISYDSDVDLAMQIIREEAMAHPSYIDNRQPEGIEEGQPSVRVRLIGFGDSSVNLRGYVWASDPITGFIMKCDLFKSIKARFDAEGVEIPFPYRTVVFKKDQQA
jgi:small-conductance mechanosensitive channel